MKVDMPLNRNKILFYNNGLHKMSSMCWLDQRHNIVVKAPNVLEGSGNSFLEKTEDFENGLFFQEKWNDFFSVAVK